MELVVGCRNKTEVNQVQHLISEFTLIQLVPAISNQAYDWLINYNKSYGLLIPDALIAATAFIQNMELVTDNLKDFKMLPGLQVRKPY
jgi:predicted nucleic acid-binding protein